MQGHFWHQFLTQLFMLFHMVASIFFSMAAPITTNFKDSDWLLKNFDPKKNGSKSYHGEKNRRDYVKKHRKLYAKQVHFVDIFRENKQCCIIYVQLTNIPPLYYGHST